MSADTSASIVSIVYQKEKSSHKEMRYSRIPASTVNLLADHGIEGDRKAGKSKRRQLNVLAWETVQQLHEEGCKTLPGELGEQIVIKGLDIEAMPRGTQIQLGDEAVIEITMLREPCDWFGDIHDINPEKVEGRVGIMARVITGGQISVGDAVKLIVPETTS